MTGYIKKDTENATLTGCININHDFHKIFTVNFQTCAHQKTNSRLTTLQPFHRCKFRLWNLPHQVCSRNSPVKFAGQQFHWCDFSCEICGWFCWFLPWCRYNQAVSEENNQILLFGFLLRKKKCITKRRKYWFGVNETNFSATLSHVLASRTVSLFPARLWSYMCRLCLKSTVSFMLCQPSPFFLLKIKWKAIWRELGPAHFQARFACKEKSFATRSKEKYSCGEFEGWCMNFKSMELHSGINVGSRKKKKKIRLWNSLLRFVSEIRVNGIAAFMFQRWFKG